MVNRTGGLRKPGREVRARYAAVLGNVVAVAAVALVAAACATPAPTASAPELPVIIRALAPDYPERISIRRLSDDVERERLIDVYRMVGKENRRIFLALRTSAWWLVIPRAQPVGGHRLHIEMGDELASACLAPPRGPASQAFARPAYLVALPRSVTHIDWRDECPSPGETSEPRRLRRSVRGAG